MLVFIGLGLFDEKDISLKGLEEAQSCDMLFAEFYTSMLAGATAEDLEKMIGKKIHVLDREWVENSELVVDEAKTKKVGFLVAGDPLISTTHASLRLDAARKGIETRVVHGASIYSAAPGVSGLFNYKFGRSASIPFPQEGYSPESFYDVVRENQKLGLHTLLFLDIKDRPMTVNEALRLLLEIEGRRKEAVFTDESLVVGLGCVGSREPVIIAGKAGEVRSRDFGPVPHVLIVPGRLHFMEEEYLKEFGGL